MRPAHMRLTLAAMASLACIFPACTDMHKDAGAGVLGQPAKASARSYPSAPPDPIGSLRNARVAFPDAKGTTLTFLAGEIPGDELAEIRRIAPNLTVLHGLTRDEALSHAAEAHGVDARFATPAFLEHAPNLVWVQAMSAGVEHLLAAEPLANNDRIVITNMRAVHGPAIADHAFAMLLTLTRNMRAHAAHQANALWARPDDSQHPSIALHGRTMLVVGLGGIGTEIAARAHGFGMRVTAIRRSDTPSSGTIERVGRPDDLLVMLPEADVVAICVPLTPETEGMFNAVALDAMKPGSYLINVARGGIVDTAALLASLESGRLAGACLDVTEPEPLPPDHPLWKRADVVITPHVASDAELTRERRWALYRENLRRFASGEPLMNVVDKDAGY